MAITKVTGHVIDPITNITSHNINSSGIITATRFDGPIGAGLTDGNFSGIITSTQLNVTGVGTFNGIGVTSLNVSGVSTFTGVVNANGNIELADNVRIRLGTSNDLQIWHSGSESFISDAGTGGITMYADHLKVQSPSAENIIVGTQNSSVDLYYDNTKRLATTNTGAIITGICTATDFSGAAGGAADFPNGLTGTTGTFSGNVTVGGVLTYEDVTNIDSLGIVTARTGIKVLAGGINAVGVVTATSFAGDGSALTGIAGTAHVRTASLTVSGVSTFSELVKFDANVSSTPSASGNVHIYRHDNKLKVCGASGIQFEEGGFTRWHITNGALHPHGTTYNNLGNTSNLVGNVYIADNKKIYLGSDQDTEIYHTGSAQYITNTTGNLVLDNSSGVDMYINSGNDIYIRPQGTENGIKVIGDGAVELYHNGSTYTTPKIKTSTTGVTVDGEVAATQDYPNFRPTLDFNFAATKTLDPRITYYRTGPASYVNEFGKVVLVGDNAPRFDHDLETRESKGLLIEESRTNFMKYSDEFAIDHGQTGGNWDDIAGGSTWTRVSDTTETKDPAGTYHASKLTHNSGNVLRGYWYSGAADGAVSKTFSVYLKRATSNATNVTIDIGDTSSTTCVLTDEWKRFSVTTSSAGNGNFVDFGATNGRAFYAWGCQIEAGGFSTSYIPTSTAAATRGNEYAVIDGEDFTDFYNPVESSVLAVGTMHRPAASQGQLNIFHIGDDNEDGHGVFREHGTKDVWYHIRNGNSTPSGGNLNPSGFGDWDEGEEARIAIAFKDGDQAISVNGGNQITATVTSNYPTANITKMWIGSHGTGSFFVGTIKRIAYYPKQLSDSQLNTLTA